MDTALAASASTAIRPGRSLREWIARSLATVGVGRRRSGHVADREELARHHQLRQEARRLREEQFRAGAFARLL